LIIFCYSNALTNGIGPKTSNILKRKPSL